MFHAPPIKPVEGKYFSTRNSSNPSVTTVFLVPVGPVLVTLLAAWQLGLHDRVGKEFYDGQRLTVEHMRLRLEEAAEKIDQALQSGEMQITDLQFPPPPATT